MTTNCGKCFCDGTKRDCDCECHDKNDAVERIVEQYLDDTGKYGCLSGHWLRDALHRFKEDVEREMAGKIIAHFKNVWLGDDYHGEAIEHEIRTLLSNPHTQ